MSIDLVGRDIQGIETVANEGQVIHPRHRFSARPDSLSEPGTEEVVRHAPVGGREEGERVHERSAAWNASVASGNRDGLVERPADVAGNDDRSGPCRCPDGEAVSRSRVENVAAQDEHRAIDRDVVTHMNVAGNTQVVGVSLVAILSVEISELGIDIELQQEGHLLAWWRFPDDDAIAIALGVWLWWGRGGRLWWGRLRWGRGGRLL